MPNVEEALKKGYRPQGYQRKTFDPITQQEFVQSDTALGRMAQTLNQLFTEQREQEKQRIEKLSKQFDMYKVLRDSGYDPKSAHEAVQKNQFPTAPSEESLDERKKKADIGLTEAKTKYYQDGGPKRSTIDKMTPNQLQQRLKYLDTVLPEDEAEQEAINEEKKYINQKLQEVSGYGSKIKVRRKADGKKGSIPAASFDPAKYEKI